MSIPKVPATSEHAATHQDARVITAPHTCSSVLTTVLLHHKMPPDTSCCSPPVCRMSTLGRGFVTTIVGLCTGCLPCLRLCCSNRVLGLSGPSAADSTAARLRLGVNAAVLVPLPEASVDVAVLTFWVWSWSCTHATTPRLACTAVNEGARHRCPPCESSRAVRRCMERWTAVVVQNDVARRHSNTEVLQNICGPVNQCKLTLFAAGHAA